MILEEMFHQYKILSFLKGDLSDKGHGFKSLAWINGQLDLLDNLIEKESFSILDELIRKTKYRLLKNIIKGHKNLVDIYNVPIDWQLAELDENTDEWANPDALIFATARQTLVFSNNIDGFKYVDNKWQ